MNAAAQPLRLLHVHSEHGYTTNALDAMQDEPEAVSEAEQRYLTREAKRRAQLAQRQRFEQLHDQLDSALAELRRLHLDVDIGGELNGLQRRVDKLARRVIGR